MTDKTFPALVAAQARYDLRNATSTNGAVSVKLHRVRDELEAKTAQSRKVFDEIQRRHAKQQDGQPIPLEGKLYVPWMTQAYEADPEQAAALREALLPVLTEEIAVRVPAFSEANAEWVTSETDCGAALALFMES